MMANSLAELPETYGCKTCGSEKPIGEMVLVRLRKQQKFLLRPRCKACHNARERGSRREYKRQYLRRWRKRNPELNESYWREAAERNREIAKIRARFRVIAHHEALLVQGRLRRQLDLHVSLREAEELVKKYGRCYPTRYGLTERGLKECERIRSRMRAIGKYLKPAEIRMMVYEEKEFVVKPRKQSPPYQIAAERLRRWQRERAA